MLSTTGEFLQTFAVINFLYQWCETWRNTAHKWHGNYKGRGSRKERQGNKILRSRQGDLTNLLCISSASFNPCDFNLSETGGFRQNKPRSPSTTYTKPQPRMHPGIQVCWKTSLLVFMYSDACWTFNLTGSFMMKDIDLEPRSMLWYIKGSCSDTNIFMYSAETACFTAVLKMEEDVVWSEQKMSSILFHFLFTGNGLHKIVRTEIDFVNTNDAQNLFMHETFKWSR